MGSEPEVKACRVERVEANVLAIEMLPFWDVVLGVGSLDSSLPFAGFARISWRQNCHHLRTA